MSGISGFGQKKESYAMSKYAIGIDLGGTSCKIGLFTTEGELLAKDSIPTDASGNGEKILPAIAEGILSRLQEKGISKDEIIGAGMGVPGAVTPDGKVNKAVNLGWHTVRPVAQELSDLVGIPVKVANDANVAALGENWKGAGAGLDSMIMVTLGTGIGGGIVIHNQILVGANGAAGEIGHIIVNHDEEEACNCGHHGCIEQYASATGIARVAGRILAKDDTPSALRDLETITAKDVYDAAREGDAKAKEVVDTVGVLLGRFLAVLTNTINPDAIILGGGVSHAGEILLDSIRPTFLEDAFHAIRDTRILIATLGNDAGIYGGARLVL